MTCKSVAGHSAVSFRLSWINIEAFQICPFFTHNQSIFLLTTHWTGLIFFSWDWSSRGKLLVEAWLALTIVYELSKPIRRGEEQGSESPSSLLFEPISPSSLNVYLTFSPSSLLFPPCFSLLPTFFGPFLPPPYSVPPPSIRFHCS